MRKSLIILCLTLVGATSYGQFAKGTFTLGGQLGYEHATISPNDKTSLYNVNSFSASPEAGLFVIPNLMTGLLLSYGYSSFKPGEENQSASGKSTFNNYGGGVFVRYYRNYVFVEGRYELGSSKSKQEQISESKSNYSNAQLGIGYSFLISKEIAIEPKISYKLLSSGEDYENKSNVLAFTIGIRAYIDRSKAE